VASAELVTDLNRLATELSRAAPCASPSPVVALQSRDRYGHLLASMWREGQLVQEQLVREGLCVRYTVPPNSRGRWIAYYVCSIHRWRGAAKCPGVRARMEPLEAAVLKHIERALLSEDIIVDAARRAMECYREMRTSASDRRKRLERARNEVGREIERYVHAIGQGVDLAEIHDALTKAKTRRDALTDELAAVSARRPTVTLDRSQITTHLRQWRGRLRDVPQVAQKLLRVLLTEPLAVERVPAGIRFRGQLAVGLLVGLVPDPGVSAMVPPGCHARTFRRHSVPR
jgi:Staphylococcal nuclease homologue